jgi:tetratricopeptide (TPR) repeat protein
MMEAMRPEFLRLEFSWIAVVAGLVLLSPAAHAQPSPQWQSCTGSSGADWDQQIRSCSALIESGRETPRRLAAIYDYRGIAYANKHDYARAIADFNEAIRLEPTSAYAYGNRGNAYNDKGDHERAIADLNEAIRLDPKFADAFNNRCWARFLMDRDLDRALADCTESLRLSPSNPANTINTRGAVEFKLGAFDRAIADFSAAIALNPKDAGSLYARGLAKRRSGDTAGGDADIAAAMAITADIATEYARYGLK